MGRSDDPVIARDRLIGRRRFTQISADQKTTKERANLVLGECVSGRIVALEASGGSSGLTRSAPKISAARMFGPSEWQVVVLARLDPILRKSGEEWGTAAFSCEGLESRHIYKMCTPLRCAQAYGVRKGFIRAPCGTTSQPSIRSAHLALNAQVVP